MERGVETHECFAQRPLDDGMARRKNAGLQNEPRETEDDLAELLKLERQGFENVLHHGRTPLRTDEKWTRLSVRRYASFVPLSCYRSAEPGPAGTDCIDFAAVIMHNSMSEPSLQGSR